MPKNSQIPAVFTAWRNGERAEAGHCWTDGRTIYTYGKRLLELDRDTHEVYLNVTSYSNTSSIHRNAIRSEAKRAGYPIIEVRGGGRWDADRPLRDCPRAAQESTTHA